MTLTVKADFGQSERSKIASVKYLRSLTSLLTCRMGCTMYILRTYFTHISPVSRFMAHVLDECHTHIFGLSSCKQSKHNMTSLYRTASATIRWVTLPDAGHQLREYGMKKAEDVSVAIGWLAHLVHRTGCELGIPLRYPIRLLGSASTILDPSKEPREEYPLHMPKVFGL